MAFGSASNECDAPTASAVIDVDQLPCNTAVQTPAANQTRRLYEAAVKDNHTRALLEVDKLFDLIVSECDRQASARRSTWLWHNIVVDASASYDSWRLYKLRWIDGIVNATLFRSVIVKLDDVGGYKITLSANDTEWTVAPAPNQLGDTSSKALKRYMRAALARGNDDVTFVLNRLTVKW